MFAFIVVADDRPQQYQPVQLIPYPPTSGGEPVIFLQAITDQDPANGSRTEVKLTPTAHDVTNQSSFTRMLTSFDFGTPQAALTSDKIQDTPTTHDNQSRSGSFMQNSTKQSTVFGSTPFSGQIPIPLTGSERILIRACSDDQYLPFTKENYGKEKDKWVLKRHICQYCGKRCMKPSDLTRHTKVHTGEYSFECSLCKKRFRERFNLNAHYRKGCCTP